jgi:signal transduction histidine kinase
MQTLAHELRTPVANMQYSIDAFRKRFESLPPGLQDAFLGLCDDNQRLVELIEASSGLLQGEPSRKGYQLPRSTFPSANGLVSALVEPYAEKISFVPSPGDFSLSTDPYWLGVALRNLVQNALNHGEPPVVVRLSSGRGGCLIAVEDQGVMGSRPAARKGMGMGLTITKEIVGLLGGRVRIQKKPHTTVCLELPYPEERVDES